MSSKEGKDKEKTDVEKRTEDISTKQFLLSGVNLNVLLSYLHTKPYMEVKQLIPQLMALPVVSDVKRSEKII